MLDPPLRPGHRGPPGAGARIMGLDYLYYVSIEELANRSDPPPNHPSLKYDAHI